MTSPHEDGGTGYLEACVRVGDYLHARSRQVAGGNIGDEISTVAVTEDGEVVQAILLHSDLKILLTQGRLRPSPAPLAVELRAAADRICGYLAHSRDAEQGRSPAHWGVHPLSVLSNPALLVDRGETVEVLGSVADLDEAEMDLIALLSPQTAASLAALLGGLADWVDSASLVDLMETGWLAQAGTLAQALNRVQAWSEHPSPPDPDHVGLTCDAYDAALGSASGEQVAG